MCSGGGASDRYAREQRAAEQERQARITQGMSAINNQFSTFDDSFYDKRADAYTQFAMPQLNEQYSDSYRGLRFGLARQGIGQSSEGNRRFGGLRQLYDRNRQVVVDASLAAAAEARKAVEDTRSGLITDLYNTADPSAAAAGALSRMSYLSAPQAPSPLGQLFANTLDGLNTYQSHKADSENYRSALGQYGLNSNGSAKGSGRVIPGG